MRIDSNWNVGPVRGVRPKQFYGVDEPAAAGRDSIELSTRAAEFQAALEALAGAPEVREDRVAELRGQIERGTFDAAMDELAEKLMRP